MKGEPCDTIIHMICTQETEKDLSPELGAVGVVSDCSLMTNTKQFRDQIQGRWKV